MTGERQLLGGGEDADPVVGGWIFWWKQERGLGEIGPGGEALELAVLQTFRVDHNRQAVALGRDWAEDVDLDESS